MALVKSKVVFSTLGVSGVGAAVSVGGVLLWDVITPIQEESTNTSTALQISDSTTNKWWQRGSNNSTSIDTLRTRLNGLGDFLKGVTSGTGN